jgi:hypothetical protein
MGHGIPPKVVLRLDPGRSSYRHRLNPLAKVKPRAACRIDLPPRLVLGCLWKARRRR